MDGFVVMYRFRLYTVGSVAWREKPGQGKKTVTEMKYSEMEILYVCFIDILFIYLFLQKVMALLRAFITYIMSC